MFAVANDTLDGQKGFRQGETQVEEARRETLSPVRETGKGNIVNGICHCLRTPTSVYECVYVYESELFDGVCSISVWFIRRFGANEVLTK